MHNKAEKETNKEARDYLQKRDANFKAPADYTEDDKLR
jgi:hypothetical protein